MEISILLGSIRQERQSHRLAYYLKNQIMSRGENVNLIDFKNYSLPLYGSVISEEEVKKVEAIIGMLRSSQAIIIVTPEYHSNISAALKNVMEYCGIDFVGKVTGIASTSTSRFGGVHASNTLQITLLNIGRYLLPRRLLVPEIHHAFDQDNEPVRDEIREQIEKFLNELLSYTNFMKNKVSLTSA